MADKSIAFTVDMAHACWEGRKCMTRRIPKLDIPDDADSVLHLPEGKLPDLACIEGNDTRAGAWASMASTVAGLDDPGIAKRRLSYIGQTQHKIGDRLWVREPWATLATLDDLAPSEFPARNRSSVHYLATRAVDRPAGRYRNARFMPRWASRMTLIITGVKIERVQDISRDDAIAEGVLSRSPSVFRDNLVYPEEQADEPIAAFHVLWNAINGQKEGRGWDDNPWVVAYSFEVHRKNIDKMGGNSE